MDLMNGKNIAKDLLGRYNFASLYFENGFSWEKELSNFHGEPSDAVDFLLAAAFTGNKVAGFFKMVPDFKIKYFLRGECVFISETVPSKIKWPIIFCRKPEDFAHRFETALKVSREGGIPVIFVVSSNAVNGYSQFVKPDVGLARTSPYINISYTDDLFSPIKMEERILIAEKFFKADLPQKPFEQSSLSFENTDFEFFDYLLPLKNMEIISSLVGKTISAPESEAEDLKTLLLYNYDTNVDIQPIIDQSSFEIREFLCPGCPFVTIFSKIQAENKIIFTDISCEGLFKAFKLVYSTLDSYAGLVSKGLNAETLFIGTASSYKPYHKEFLKKGRVIFLNDYGIANIKICSSVNHPKKFTKENKNILYPYGCFNIKKYSKLKVNLKKCVCNDKNESCDCIEKTKCPALYHVNGRVSIDKKMCTGCYNCKVICKYGAIS